MPSVCGAETRAGVSARAAPRGARALRPAAVSRVVPAAAGNSGVRAPAAPSALNGARVARRGAVRGAARAPAVRVVAAAAPRAAAAAGPTTLFDKIWADHVVECAPDGTCLLYIDRHLVHEVTSPQAFEGLRNAGRVARRPDMTLATADHNVPTSDRSGFTDVASFIKEVESRTQARAAALTRRAPPPRAALARRANAVA
jgi:hypothetical protein